MDESTLFMIEVEDLLDAILQLGLPGRESECFIRNLFNRNAERQCQMIRDEMRDAATEVVKRYDAIADADMRR